MRHVVLFALVFATGCEAVVHFDRSKIDGGSPSDGGMNAAARASALVAEDGGARSASRDASASGKAAASDDGDFR